MLQENSMVVLHACALSMSPAVMKRVIINDINEHIGKETFAMFAIFGIDLK